MSLKWRSISILVLCEVLAMTLWFSSSATIPALRAEFALTDLQASLISSSVNVGFVVGTILSAMLGLADRLNLKWFFAVSTFVAAAANSLILMVDPTSILLPLLRFLVGICMAGIYPVGMKMASSWAKADMGLLVGILVAALTFGSAAPHMIDAFGGLDWRLTIAAASVAAGTGALLIAAFALGPNMGRTPPFKLTHMFDAWKNRPLRYANLGYFGHMWELYAMWAWIGVFLQASFALNPGGPEAAFWARIASFAIIAAGALGSLYGGYFADRMGRTTLTIGALSISGSCALAAGFLFGASPWLLVSLCLVWGISIVADSAQFSASVIELSDPTLTGTMVTIQTCIGFLLTIITIHMIPPLVAWVGWSFAFMPLVIGPVIGVVAMARLRAMPESLKLAHGRR
ncbi:MFS transporter [Aestuariispira insulae]|uniref:Nitrate/nitrite transporter NarK n=1 Tax=Aestuariispira insulae TaxID=1461337 RepID=A0A3D9HXE5_9PROT|nr:MFS transporter [Aestuariispira insulae]RED54089.1 nitrate/nitrite transporter NarK [Aestuariispira insulae]